MFLNTQAGRDDLPAHRAVKGCRKNLSLSLSSPLSTPLFTFFAKFYFIKSFIKRNLKNHPTEFQKNVRVDPLS